MKKLFIFTLMCFGSTFVMGQTYYYRYLHWVEKETEVKHAVTNPEKYNTYVTFVNNKATCYFSDSKGNTTEKESSCGIGYQPDMWSGGVKYSYQGYSNGRHVYMSIETFSKCSPFWSPYPNVNEDGVYHNVYDKKKYLYFNDDYSRMNKWTDPIYYVYDCRTSNVVKSVINTYAGYNGKEHSTSIEIYERATAPELKTDGPVILY